MGLADYTCSHFYLTNEKKKKEQNKYLLYDYIRRICFSTRTPIIFGLDSNFAYLLCDCAPFFLLVGLLWQFMVVLLFVHLYQNRIISIISIDFLLSSICVLLLWFRLRYERDSTHTCGSFYPAQSMSDSLSYVSRMMLAVNP